MERVSAIKRAGEWDAQRAADTVVLDATDRHRRRIVFVGEQGACYLLDMPRPAQLRNGDALVLENGACVRVAAKAEMLVEVAAADAAALARLAWHLGNRHTEVQFTGDRLRIRRDHVLEEMLRGLGAQLTFIEAPFDPEGGAHRHGLAMAISRKSPSTPDLSPPLAPLAGGGERALYRLLAWLSPAYPVGAFAYSGGIEWAVEAGDIKDASTLQNWIEALLRNGPGLSDAVLFVHAYRAVEANDRAALREIAELAAALAPSKERHLESTTQGAAFVDATQKAWPCAALTDLKAVWDGAVAYAIAVAVAAAGHAVPVEQALSAFVQALLASWVSAGVRLVPLGQTDGLRIIASLEPVVAETAARALATSLDDMGTAVIRADLASMRHETQYTRLFRS